MLVDGLAVSGGMQKLVLRTAIEMERMGHSVRVFAREVDRASCYPDLIQWVNVIQAPSGLDQLGAAEWFGQRLDAQDLIIIHDVATLPAVAGVSDASCVVWMLNHEYAPRDFSYVRAAASVMRRLDPFRMLPQASRSIRAVRARRAGVKKVNIATTYDRANAQAVRRRFRLPTKVVYAGADLEEFQALSTQRTKSPSLSGSMTLLSVGVLMPHRRYEDLINAVDALHPHNDDFRLLIAGSPALDRPYASRLQTLISELGLQDRVRLLGAVTDAQMRSLYVQADAFAFVNDGQTWGISVFEAVAAGLPVILTDNVGAADLLIDGEHAWLVPPREPQAIADAVNELWSTPDRGAEVAGAAFANIQGILSWSSFTERLIHAATLANPSLRTASG